MSHTCRHLAVMPGSTMTKERSGTPSQTQWSLLDMKMAPRHFDSGTLQLDLLWSAPMFISVKMNSQTVLLHHFQILPLLFNLLLPHLPRPSYPLWKFNFLSPFSMTFLNLVSFLHLLLPLLPLFSLLLSLNLLTLSLHLCHLCHCQVTQPDQTPQNQSLLPLWLHASLCMYANQLTNSLLVLLV